MESYSPHMQAAAAELLRLKDGLKQDGFSREVAAAFRAAELLRLKDGLKLRLCHARLLAYRGAAELLRLKDGLKPLLTLAFGIQGLKLLSYSD